MMALLLAAGLCFAGLACLARAMPAHWEDLGRPPRSVAARRRLRLLGLALAGAACFVCLWREGPGFGSLLWALLLSAAGIVLALGLAWRQGDGRRR